MRQIKFRAWENKMTIGQLIKKYREESGLTQKELAIKAGVNEYNISNYEADITTPKTNVFLRIIEAMNMQVVCRYKPALANVNDVK